MEEPIDVRAAWLLQAIKVRNEALNLLHERIEEDLRSATQLFDGRSPDVLASEAEYASKVIADYLIESERLLALTNRLVHDGLSCVPQNGQETVELRHERR